jgi:four helix bundle protein
MPRFINLRVWNEAREILKIISRLTAEMPGEGDIRSQMRRAALSIVSNISEGSDRGSDREFHRFLAMARGSCGELHAQVLIAGDLALLADSEANDCAGRLDRLGRMLTKFMQTLEGGG